MTIEKMLLSSLSLREICVRVIRIIVRQILIIFVRERVWGFVAGLPARSPRFTFPPGLQKSGVVIRINGKRRDHRLSARVRLHYGPHGAGPAVIFYCMLEPFSEYGTFIVRADP